MKYYTILLLLFIISSATKIFGQCKAKINSDSIICSGESITLKSDTIGIWYSSNDNYKIEQKTNSKIFNINPFVTTSYKFYKKGCIDSSKVTIKVNPLPQIPSFNYTQNKCSNELIEFTNTTSETGLKYSWNFGSSTSSLINPTYTFPTFFGNATSPYDVTLEVINSNGCKNKITKVIDLKQIPDPNIQNYDTKPFTNCGAADYKLKVSDKSTTKSTNKLFEIDWGDGSTSYKDDKFPDPPEHTYTKKGYSYLTYKLTGENGCKNEIKKTIFNGTNPSVGLSNPGGTVNLCVSEELVFPITSSNGNPPGTSYLLETNTGKPSVTYNHPPPNSYKHYFDSTSCGATGGTTQNSYFVRIKAENPCGFSYSTIEPITTSIKPKADFKQNPDKKACKNTIVSFTNTSKEGVIVDNYGICDKTTINNWNITPSTGWTLTSGSKLGDINPTLDPDTWGSNILFVNFSNPGTYNISMIVRNSCGNDTITKPYCIQSPPVPSFTATPKNGCSPLVSNFTNTSTNINQCDTVTRQWIVTKVKSTCDKDSTLDYRFLSGTSETSMNPIIRFNNEGEYSVVLQLTNMCGVFKSSVESFVVGRKPKLSINAPNNICFGETIKPSASSQDCGNTISSYNWTFSNATPASSNALNAPTINYSSAGTKTISLEATNTCGTTKETKSIDVLNPPNVNAGLDQKMCTGDTIKIGSTTIANLTYNWSPTIGLSSSSISNPTLTLSNNTNAAIIYKYILTAINIANCKNKDSLLVTVNPLPDLTITPATEICAKKTISLTVNGADVFTWSPSTDLNTTSGNTVVSSPIKTITYTVSGTNSTTNCKNSISTSITVNPLPIVNAGDDQTLCNQPIPVEIKSISSNGNWSGTNITADGTYTPNGVGTTIAYYNIIDSKGCKNKDSILVTVKNPQTVEAGNDISECLNTVSKTLIGTPSDGAWSGTSLVTANGTLSFSQAGIHKLYYTIGSGSCITKDSLQVIVKPLPIVNAGNDLTNCINDPNFNLTGSPLGGTWSGTGVSNAGIFSPSTAKAGIKTITYSYTDALTTCANKDDVSITINDITTVNAGIDTTVCNQPIPFKIVGSPVNGVWTGTGISPDGIFTPNSTGNFTLTYTFKNSFNCSNSDTREVKIINPTDAEAGSDLSICIDTASIQLNGSPSDGTWAGNSNVTQAGIFKPQIAGNFKLFYNYGLGTCARKDSMTINIKSLPEIVANNDTSICINGGNISIKSSPSGGIWSGNGIDKNLGLFNPLITGKGAFKVFYQFTDPSSTCNNKEEVNIIVNDTTTLFVGGDTTLCNQPLPVQLLGKPSGGSWSGTNITINGLYTPATIGDFVLTYSFTNNFSCKNKIQKKISIITPIQANAGKDDSICFDQTTKQLSGLPINGIWTGQSISSNGTFTRTIPGNYFNVYSYGTGNCLTRDTMKLIVQSILTVNAGNDKSFCGSDQTFNFNGFPIGGSWRGPGIVDPVNGTFDPTKVTSGKHNIIYTYFDSKTGCSNEDTLIANVNPLPIVDFNIKPIICINVEEQLTNNTQFHGSSSWSFGNQTTSTLENPKITYTNIGSYTVKLIETSPFGCIDSLSKNIQVLDPPKAIFTIDRDSVCSPAKITITENSYGSGIKYNWDFGNGKFDSVKSPQPVTYLQGVIADTIYHLKLNVSNLCGISTQIRNIKVMPIPTAIFHTNVLSGCTPLPIDFYNKTLGLPKQYKWDFSNGTSTTKDSLFQRVFTTDSVIKTYQVTLIALNNCGSDTMTKSIVVKPNTVKAFFGIDKNEGCNDLAIKFTENSIGQTFSSWDFGDGNKSVEKNPTHIYKKAGNFIAKLYITNGCSYDTANLKINVLHSPVIDFTSSSDSLCQFGIFKFNSFTQDTVSLEWEFGDGIKSQEGNTEHMYLSSGSFLVKLKATNMKNGCETNKSETIFVHRKPIASFEMDTTQGCVPLSILFSNNSIDAKFYSWNFDDGNTSNQKELKHTYTKSGILKVQLIIESAFGCKDTIVKNINPFPIPEIDFNYTMTDPCYSPLFVNFTNNSIGAINYQWNFGNGILSTLSNPDTKYLNTGVYPVSLIGSNTYNCKVSLTKSIIVNQKPKASFNLNILNGCMPLSVEIVNNSLFSSFYSWNFKDGNTSNTKDPKHTFTKDGKYDITLITENKEGCKDTMTKSILVYPLPIADFTFINSDPCFQPMKISTNNSTIGGINYIWEFGNGITSNLTHPIIDYTTVGNHMILLRAQNEYGCEDVSKQFIKNYNTPKLSPNILPSGYCEKDELVYSINSLFVNKIRWNMGNGNINTGASFNYAYPTQGNYTITVVGLGEGGCKDSIELLQKVVVNPDPIANFEHDPIQYDELLNGSVEFRNLSKQADDYLWRFGDGTTSETINPIHKFINSGDYTTTLIAYNKFKCSDSITKKIHVDFFKGLHVPNAIYLGHQDYQVSHFIPKGVGMFEYEITIYDDWGNLIWRSTALDYYGKPTESWDGTYKGEYVQQDSYVWKVNATFRDNSVWEGKEYQKSVYNRAGTVTVIK